MYKTKAYLFNKWAIQNLTSSSTLLTNLQMSPCLIKAICWIGPYRVEWKIPQTNINPEPDPAACQEDERLREWKGGRRGGAFHFP